MRSRDDIIKRINKLKEDYDTFSESNARAGDYDLNRETENEIETLKWVLNEKEPEEKPYAGALK